MEPSLALIRQFEGYRDTPYWDVNAYRTGYGSDTITLPDGSVRRVEQGMTISRDDAERDLARRVSTEFAPGVARSVGSDVWASLSEPQKAALTSIAYNYGSLPGSVARAVASGDQNAAAAAIRGLGSHNNGVNADRRAQEAAIYAGGASIPVSSGGADAGRANNPPPVDMNPARLAWAYRTGRMTPDDKALYERGIAAGKFQAPAQPAQQPDPLAVYAQTAQRQRAPVQTIDIGAGMKQSQWPGFAG